MNEEQIIEEQRKWLYQASYTAGMITFIGFILSIALCCANQYFQLSILNFIINIIIGILLFYLVFFFAEEKICTYYKKYRYFHFYITTFIFGVIIYWCINSLVFQGDFFLLSFKIFLINNVVYHIGEFYFVCLSHPRELKWSSFLINHSTQYSIALTTAIIEYFLGEVFPNFFLFILHNRLILILVGQALCLFGHILRIGAQQTAKSNFTHIVQSQKKETHQLVTHGVYSFSRHPSYLGFYSYSVGGQIILGNIICIFAYAYVLFKFFLFRIVDEEYHLVKFFGEEYVQYRERVPIRIPFLESAMHKQFEYED